MAGPTVFRLLDLSTGHLKLSTRRILEAGGLDAPGQQLWLPRTVPHEYGWFMWADTDPGNVESFPEDIAAATRLAHRLQCEWILFDRDAAPIADVPFYGDGDEPEPPAED
jgi:hypothetical protein